MALPAVEPFTGTGALSANWTQQLAGGNIVRSSDQGACDTAAATAAAFWNADVFPNDQYAKMTLRTTPNGTNYGAVIVRSSGVATTSGYTLYAFDGTTFLLYKTVSGTSTLLQTISGLTVISGDVIKISVVGQTLKCFQNDVKVGTDQTDGDIGTGSGGLAIVSNVFRVDDWEAGPALPPDDGFLVPIATFGSPSVVGTW